MRGEFVIVSCNLIFRQLVFELLENIEIVLQGAYTHIVVKHMKAMHQRTNVMCIDT